MGCFLSRNGKISRFSGSKFLELKITNRGLRTLKQCSFLSQNVRKGEKMTRKEEILKYINENRPNDCILLSQIVDDVVFLEERLSELRKLPLVEVHPVDKTKQRATPSAKLYKELLQQYNNCVKLIVLKAGGDESEEESPLRLYMKKRIEVR